MIDLNNVKAGKYELVVESWDQLQSKPGEPLDFVRHAAGAIVDLNVEDARRLVAAGAVVKPGERERVAAEQAKAAAEQAKRQYEAAIAALPDDVRDEIEAGFNPDDAANDSVDDVASGKPGTIEEVLAQVGNDPAKAAAALAAEQATGRPRSTLVATLQDLIDNPGGDAR